MVQPIHSPFILFTDSDGSPLDSGYIYYGVYGLNPETSPINVYLDSNLSNVASQPIRTINGYPDINGSPAKLFLSSNYSITVRNKKRELVFSSLFEQYDSTEFQTQQNAIACANSAAQSANSASQSASSAAQSSLSASNAAISATTAINNSIAAENYAAASNASRIQSELAASTSGAVRFYDTKASATSDLANIPADGIVEVIVDESLFGARARYRKQNNALVFKYTFPGADRGFKSLTEWGAIASQSVPSVAIQTSNRTAIQTALDSNEPIYVPPGIFWVNGPLIYCRNGNQLMMTGAGMARSEIAWNTSDSDTAPLFHPPEGYINHLDQVVNASGVLYPSVPGVGTGRKIHLENFTMTTKYGKNATVFFSVNTTNPSNYIGMGFTSAYRGLFISQGFNHVIVGCNFKGIFFAAQTGRTAANILQEKSKSFGVYLPGHATIIEASVTGWGIGAILAGVESSLRSARIEVNGIGCMLGGKDYFWDTWNGTSLATSPRPFGGTVDCLVTESNECGLLAQNVYSSTVVSNVMVTGFNGATPTGVNPKYGMLLTPQVASTATFDGINVSGNFDYAALINLSRAIIRQPLANNMTSENDEVGFCSAVSKLDNINQRSSLWNVLLNPSKNSSLNDAHARTSFESQLTVRGLTGLNIRDAQSFSNNLGGSASINEGATTSAISFLNERNTNGGFATFPTATANASSTLAAGTYFYAYSLVGKRGQTGVQYTPGDDTQASVLTSTYRSVVVASGQQVTMQIYGATGIGTEYLIRWYRGRVSGFFDGYFETNTTTFVDSGQSFSGFDYPPTVGAVIPSQFEVDSNYQIIITPSWNTTVWVTNKLTSGFTVNFGTAAPAGGTISWLLFRP